MKTAGSQAGMLSRVEERIMNRNRKGVIFGSRIIAVGILCMILVADFVLSGMFDRDNSAPVPEPVLAESVRILFAGTKDDADCAIVLSQDACVMIDTGEEQDAEHILALLQQEGVEEIDCLILTHPDKDHIGGAPALLESLPVQKILTPVYDQSKESYERLTEQAEALGIMMTALEREEELQYKELSLHIWPPEETEYDKDNNYSLAVLVSHGEVQMFFAGDAQKKRMKEILQYNLPQVDLYKVSYHGRSLASGVRLIDLIRPQYAVVTAAEPEKETEQALRSVGAQIFCTREHDVVFVSDGIKIRPE